eukprot:scaffold193647_cov38-Prasinocladus_malaysianus.AAC.1
MVQQARGQLFHHRPMASPGAKQPYHVVLKAYLAYFLPQSPDLASGRGEPPSNYNCRCLPICAPMPTDRDCVAFII